MNETFKYHINIILYYRDVLYIIIHHKKNGIILI